MPIGGTAFMGQNQHPRITTLYLNSLNRHGDPGPGVNLGGQIDMVNGGTVGFSGGIVQPYAGFCGGKLTITDPWAPQFADPAVGPLYGGVYQYVQFDVGSVTPPTRGAVCFWSDELNYVVTCDYSATASYKPAGIVINATEPGNWDFIQIAGISMALFNAALAVGAMAGASTAATPPTPAGALAATPGGANTLGVVVMAPGVSGAVSPLELNILAGWNY